MNDDVVTRLRAEVCWCYDGETCVTCDAANWIDLYRNIIWHMWANHQNCGSQTCALCVEAYRVYNEEYERMLDDE
jgi:hypothetical protein